MNIHEEPAELEVLNFGQNHIHLNFKYASSEGSDESVYLCSLA